MSAARYTAAMLADLVGVQVARVRAWQRRNWIVPVDEQHRLAYFDFEEVRVARQLAALEAAGLSTQALARRLKEIERRFPEVGRPLAELSLLAEGRTLLVRRGDDLLEPGGQLRIDFDAPRADADDAAEQARISLPSPAVFLARGTGAALEEAAPAQLAAWAAELDEAGDLPGAAEMYRAALAAGGPRPELCFQLAESLYRAGDISAARERYFMALELDEDYVEARVNLGCVLLDLGERELAVAAFTGAIRSHEAYADAHYHLARALDDLGRTVESAPHWQRFAELAPDSPWRQ